MDEVVDAAFAIECRSLPVSASRCPQRSRRRCPGSPRNRRRGCTPCTARLRAQRAGSAPRVRTRCCSFPIAPGSCCGFPKARLRDAAALSGQTLDVAGFPMHVGRLQPRPLLRIASLFSRSVLLEGADREEDFLAAAARELGALGIATGPLLCGRDVALATPQRTYRARSLMVTVGTPAQSLALQRQGLGEARKLGCGLFIPHKDVGDLRGAARPRDDWEN